MMGLKWRKRKIESREEEVSGRRVDIVHMSTPKEELGRAWGDPSREMGPPLAPTRHSGDGRCTFSALQPPVADIFDSQTIAQRIGCQNRFPGLALEGCSG